MTSGGSIDYSHTRGNQYYGKPEKKKMYVESRWFMVEIEEGGRNQVPLPAPGTGLPGRPTPGASGTVPESTIIVRELFCGVTALFATSTQQHHSLMRLTRS